MTHALQNEDLSVSTAVLIHWMLFASVFIYGGLAYALSIIMDEGVVDPSQFTLWVAVMSAVSLLVFVSVLFRPSEDDVQKRLERAGFDPAR